MSRSPVRLLVIGYGVASLGGALWRAMGGGALSAALLAWIGGAVLVLLIAAGVARGKGRDRPALDEDAPALAASLARWEADRVDDAARVSPPTAVAGTRRDPAADARG